jgi:hypothetical protein
MALARLSSKDLLDPHFQVGTPIAERTMRINDFSRVTHYAGSIEQIDKILHQRYGNGVNEFFLAHGDERYPVISLQVSGRLACMYYFPREGHPGFVSLGDLKSVGLQPGGETTFYVAPDQPIWAINEHVISFSDALKVVHEFCGDPALPKSIEWFEL